MKRIVCSAVTAATLTIVGAETTSAATITSDYTRGDGRMIDIARSSQGSQNNVFAGNFILDPTTGDNIITFCADIANEIGNGVTYQLKSLAESGFSATVQSNINRLFSTFYAGLGGGNTETAAFQVALWEIIDERPGNQLRLAEGRFRLDSSSVRTRAQQMLNNLGEATNNWMFTFYDADGYQDQLGATPFPVGGQVPLPAGLPLLLTVAGGFVLVRKAKKNA